MPAVARTRSTEACWLSRQVISTTEFLHVERTCIAMQMVQGLWPWTSANFLTYSWLQVLPQQSASPHSVAAVAATTAVEARQARLRRVAAPVQRLLAAGRQARARVRVALLRATSSRARATRSTSTTKTPTAVAAGSPRHSGQAYVPREGARRPTRAVWVTSSFNNLRGQMRREVHWARVASIGPSTALQRRASG